ncbi:putative elongation factor Tu GTP-binding domain-containing protein [Neospora caninum Liverpool]|uniref:Elongation factor Tu GTP-binding domain-containing protein, putative n=1 Tax=Neospora caninum (strain Liverpool) TaxID=572307 RepID=F0VP65_NEOCL|nr:putative elongation factor Tu GTP-binding domain-containing protein [Neospora caninum Liverpool]CBZ55511.1 putative elongation factor Tu GTP-binding domain-containing protein [Neospora caninum Liverpool]CEL70249.1 TPA: elongation factor Tu GTP-binding domain-containing protein, putative [Neospora caninum Liverpool]|eukprot:XP_003885539.1 putative elongation factor Tu GTP-binding domain-containing protein [Neospora caninum Liverpool]
MERVKCCCGNPVYANVGVLGHIDSGKTSLVRVLTAVRSTASLDKHPQSRERGITIDLGFSAFTLPLDTSGARPASHGGRTNCPPEGTVESRDAEKREAEEARSFCSEDPSAAATRLPAKADSAHSRACTLAHEAENGGASENARKTNVQVCLVDCPGHASLIRTIIGGAQIIDLVLLVIDATKGIQTQTAECLVVAELLARHLIVVLNKIDLFPEATREKKVASVTAKLRGVFAQTAFGADVPIVPVAANPDAVQDLSNLPPAWNVAGVLSALSSVLLSPELAANAPRDAQDVSSSRLVDRLWLQQRCTTCACCRGSSAPATSSPFYLVFDHCFALKGKGTVLTGTVLSGRVKVGDSVVVLSAAGGGGATAPTKVRSLQTFRQNVESAGRGQRVAVCVTALDASGLERGAICDPQHVPAAVDGCIAIVERIRFYKPQIGTGTKFHCTVGHATTLCTAYFFGRYESDQPDCTAFGGAAALSQHLSSASSAHPDVGTSSLNVGRLVPSLRGDDRPSLTRAWPTAVDFRATYRHQEELVLLDSGMARSRGEQRPRGLSRQTNGVDASFLACEEEKPVLQFALLVFDKPIVAPLRSILICSKLDMDVSSPMCRLSFFGQMLERLSAAPLLSLSATAGVAGQRSNAAKKPPGSGPRVSTAAAIHGSSASVRSIFYHPAVLSLPVYKWKHKLGSVERFIFESPCHYSDRTEAADRSYSEARSLIGRGLFKSPQHVSRFIGFRVTICRQEVSDTQADGADEPSKTDGSECEERSSEKRAVTARNQTASATEEKTVTEELDAGARGRREAIRFEGRIEKAFGNKGKFVVELETPISCSTLSASGKGNGDSKASGFSINLEYKKKVYDKSAQFSQGVQRGAN